MSTPLDDIRNADATMLREVWQWGGYEAAHGPYPGRGQALFVITARDVAESCDGPQTTEEVSGRQELDLQAAINVAAQLMCMAWALAFVATGYVPDQPRREDLASAPRARRTARRHPFRSVVRCTAPPARRARSAGQQVT